MSNDANENVLKHIRVGPVALYKVYGAHTITRGDIQYKHVRCNIIIPSGITEFLLPGRKTANVFTDHRVYQNELSNDKHRRERYEI